MNWLQRIFEQGEITEADEARLKDLGFLTARDGHFTDLECQVVFEPVSDDKPYKSFNFRVTLNWIDSRIYFQLGTNLGDGFNDHFTLYDMVDVPLRSRLTACQHARKAESGCKYYSEYPEAFENLIRVAEDLERALCSDGVDNSTPAEGDKSALKYTDDNSRLLTTFYSGDKGQYDGELRITNENVLVFLSRRGPEPVELFHVHGGHRLKIAAALIEEERRRNR